MKSILATASLATALFAAVVHSNLLAPTSAHAATSTQSAPKAPSDIMPELPSPSLESASDIIMLPPDTITASKPTAKATATATAPKAQGWFCTSMRENLVGGSNADCRASL